METSPDDSTAISSFSSPLIELVQDYITTTNSQITTTTAIEGVPTSGYTILLVTKEAFFIIIVGLCVHSN